MYPGLKSTGLVFAEKPSIGIEPTNLPDRSRFGRDGVHDGVTMVQLPSGLWVRSFGGDGDHIDWSSVLPAQATLGITVLAWFQRQGDSGGATSNIYHELMGHIWGHTSNSLRIPKAGTSVYVGIDCSGFKSATINLTDATKFHQVGILWDSANVYAIGNGVLGTGTAAIPPVSTGSENLIVGRYAADYHYTNGYLALVKMFNYALTPAQIRAIYSAERHWFGV